MTLTKKYYRIVTLAIVLLALPLIATLITDEVDWSLADFVVAGVLILGAGFLYELLVSLVSSPKQRLAIGAIIMIVLFILWAELSVGIFGSPFAGS